MPITSGGYENRSQASGVMEIREEKQQMNGKLEEFASMLKQFQESQKTQREENSRLREKIEQLEN